MPCALAHRHSRLGDFDHRYFWRGNRRVLDRVERNFDRGLHFIHALANRWLLLLEHALQRIHRRPQPTIDAKPAPQKVSRAAPPSTVESSASACCSIASRAESIFAPTICQAKARNPKGNVCRGDATARADRSDQRGIARSASLNHMRPNTSTISSMVLASTRRAPSPIAIPGSVTSTTGTFRAETVESLAALNAPSIAAFTSFMRLPNRLLLLLVHAASSAHPSPRATDHWCQASARKRFQEQRHRAPSKVQ